MDSHAYRAHREASHALGALGTVARFGVLLALAAAGALAARERRREVRVLVLGAALGMSVLVLVCARSLAAARGKPQWAQQITARAAAYAKGRAFQQRP